MNAQEIVDRCTLDPETGCWNHPNVFARRWPRRLWVALNGPLTSDLQVCHTCDNPGCCNPDHLWIGTITENTADRDQKGRQAKGSGCGQAKLTEEKVLEIRRLYGPMNQYELAAEFGVTQANIGYILQRRTWNHI